MTRSLAVPGTGGSAYLIVADVGSQRFHMFELRQVRVVGGSDAVFTTRGGLEVTVPVESVVDLLDPVGATALYIVFSKTPVTVDRRGGVLRFEPYDRSVLDLVAELGKPAFDAIAEKVSMLARQAKECRMSMLASVAECHLTCLGRIDEIRKTISSAIEKLLAGEVDAARSMLTSKLMTIQEAEMRHIEELVNKSQKLMNVVRQLKDMARQLGIPEERLREMSVAELIDAVQGALAITRARIPERGGQGGQEGEEAG